MKLENNITCDGIVALCNNLKYISKLKSLDIGYNNIKDKGIIELSNNLNYVTNLNSLFLNCI